MPTLNFLAIACKLIVAEYFYIPRTQELAGDTVAKKNVIKDTLIKCEEKTGRIYDVVLDLDLTRTLRE